VPPSCAWKAGSQKVPSQDSKVDGALK
jgi:hypothetical protein